MKIKDLVEEFKTEDFSEWEMVRNRNTQALWLRRDNSCLKVHIRRDSDEQYYVRLYRFLDVGDFSGVNYRITITPEGLEFCTLQIGKDIADEEIRIEFHHNIASEESFFQQSLVQDMADLEYTNIADLIHLYQITIERSMGYI